MAPFYMSKKNDYLCVFKYADNEEGYIQCTIANKYIAEFESLGFVGNINDISKPKKKKVKSNDSNKQGQSSQRGLLSDEDKRADG